MESMKSHAKKGIDFIDFSFTLHTFNVLDHITNSKLYPYLLETHIPLSHSLMKKLMTKKNFDFTKQGDNDSDNKNALNIRF